VASGECQIHCCCIESGIVVVGCVEQDKSVEFGVDDKTNFPPLSLPAAIFSLTAVMVAAALVW